MPSSRNLPHEMPEEFPRRISSEDDDSMSSAPLPQNPWVPGRVSFDETEDSVLEADVRLLLPGEQPPVIPPPPPRRAPTIEDDEEYRDNDDDDEKNILPVTCHYRWYVLLAVVLVLMVVVTVGLTLALIDDPSKDPAGVSTIVPTPTPTNRQTPSPSPATITTSPPTTPVPTTPAPTWECQRLKNAFGDCRSRELPTYGKDFCTGCTAPLIESSSYLSCNTFRKGFCADIEGCRCGTNCSEILLDYLTCIRGEEDCLNDLQACENVHTGPPSPNTTCTRAQDELVDCSVTLTNYEYFNCEGCVDQALETASQESCDAFQKDFCPTFRECECPCAEEIQTRLPCMETNLMNCTIACL